MPGALDKVFKEAARAIVADLGDGLDTKIDYTVSLMERTTHQQDRLRHLTVLTLI